MLPDGRHTGNCIGRSITLGSSIVLSHSVFRDYGWGVRQKSYEFHYRYKRKQSKVLQTVVNFTHQEINVTKSQLEGRGFESSRR